VSGFFGISPTRLLLSINVAQRYGGSTDRRTGVRVAERPSRPVRSSRVEPHPPLPTHHVPAVSPTRARDGRTVTYARSPANAAGPADTGSRHRCPTGHSGVDHRSCRHAVRFLGCKPVISRRRAGGRDALQWVSGASDSAFGGTWGSGRAAIGERGPMTLRALPPAPATARRGRLTGRGRLLAVRQQPRTLDLGAQRPAPHRGVSRSAACGWPGAGWGCWRCRSNR